jgi:hypothetical protein
MLIFHSSLNTQISNFSTEKSKNDEEEEEEENEENFHKFFIINKKL